MVEVAKHPIPTTRVAAPVELEVVRQDGERQDARPTRTMTAVRPPGLPTLVRRTLTRTTTGKPPHGTHLLGHRTLTIKQLEEQKHLRGLPLHEPLTLTRVVVVVVARRRGGVRPLVDRQMLAHLHGMYG